MGANAVADDQPARLEHTMEAHHMESRLCMCWGLLLKIRLCGIQNNTGAQIQLLRNGFASSTWRFIAASIRSRKSSPRSGRNPWKLKGQLANADSAQKETRAVLHQRPGAASQWRPS
eukprot:5130088-Alexandrium_andersonii.AAC.1